MQNPSQTTQSQSQSQSQSYSNQLSLSTSPISTSQPRHTLYMNIREQSKMNILRNIRQNYQKAEESSQLQSIIAYSQQMNCVTEEHVKKLIQLTQGGNHAGTIRNAVVHIGNLFIQNMLNQKVFQIHGVEWLINLTPNCGYKEWLLVVLINRGCIDYSFGLYGQMINNVNKKMNQFQLINCIKCLSFLIANVNGFIQKFISIHLEQFKRPILYLLDQIVSANIELHRQSWRFLHSLLSTSKQQQIHYIISTLTPHTILNLLHLGNLSTQTKSRALACQTLTNTLSTLFSLLPFSQLEPSLLQWFQLVKSQKQKQCVKVEISYLLVNVLQCVKLSQLIQIVDSGVMGCIGVVREIGGWNEQVRENYRVMCEILEEFCWRYQCLGWEDEQMVKRIRIQVDCHRFVVQDTQI